MALAFVAVEDDSIDSSGSSGSSEADEHRFALHLDRKAPRAAFIGRARFAACEFDIPCVQRARHGLAMHDALRKRTAFVRAVVEQREHLVRRGAEDRDVALLALEHAAAET